MITILLNYILHFLSHRVLKHCAQRIICLRPNQLEMVNIMAYRVVNSTDLYISLPLVLLGKCQRSLEVDHCFKYGPYNHNCTALINFQQTTGIGQLLQHVYPFQSLYDQIVEPIFYYCLSFEFQIYQWKRIFYVSFDTTNYGSTEGT